MLTLALSVALVGCRSASPDTQDALQKAWSCGLAVGLDKLKALGPDGKALLHAINVSLTLRDLAANKSDLRRASVEFGIDVGPSWVHCFDPFFFPNEVGAGRAPVAPTGLSVRPSLNQASIEVTWNYSSDNVLYFVVSDRVEERTFVTASSTGTVSYTWAGLKPGSRVCFRVRASNGDTSSNWNPSVGYRCAMINSPGPLPGFYYATIWAPQKIYANPAHPDIMGIDNHDWITIHSVNAWLPDSVTMTGVLNYDNCQPDCASGSELTFPVQVVATTPQNCTVQIGATDSTSPEVAYVYGEITVKALSGQPPAFLVGNSVFKVCG